MRTFRMHSSWPGPGSRRATHVIADRPDRSGFAPCSPQSRRGLATAEFAAPTTRRPALTGAARGAPRELRSGRRNASVEQRNVTTSIVACVVRAVCRTANLPLDTVPHTRVGKGVLLHAVPTQQGSQAKEIDVTLMPPCRDTVGHTSKATSVTR